MKAKEVMRLLGVTRVTLCTYVKKGLIKKNNLPNGRYDYDEDSVYEFLGEKKPRVNVIYARVSTHKQKNDLLRQVNKLEEYCYNYSIDIETTYQEIASGISFERNEFNLLLQRIFNHEIDSVYITNRDRLTRLSFITMKNIFEQFGTQIITINGDLEYKDELMEELLNITHLFSTKMYANRKCSKPKKTLKNV